jgi:hypothetical protein
MDSLTNEHWLLALDGVAGLKKHSGRIHESKMGRSRRLRAEGWIA